MSGDFFSYAVEAFMARKTRARSSGVMSVMGEAASGEGEAALGEAALGEAALGEAALGEGEASSWARAGLGAAVLGAAIVLIVLGCLALWYVMNKRQPKWIQVSCRRMRVEREGCRVIVSKREFTKVQTHPGDITFACGVSRADMCTKLRCKCLDPWNTGHTIDAVFDDIETWRPHMLDLCIVHPDNLDNEVILEFEWVAMQTIRVGEIHVYPDGESTIALVPLSKEQARQVIGVKAPLLAKLILESHPYYTHMVPEFEHVSIHKLKNIPVVMEWRLPYSVADISRYNILPLVAYTTDAKARVEALVNEADEQAHAEEQARADEKARAEAETRAKARAEEQARVEARRKARAEEKADLERQAAVSGTMAGLFGGKGIGGYAAQLNAEQRTTP